MRSFAIHSSVTVYVMQAVKVWLVLMLWLQNLNHSRFELVLFNKMFCTRRVNDNKFLTPGNSYLPHNLRLIKKYDPPYSRAINVPRIPKIDSATSGNPPVVVVVVVLILVVVVVVVLMLLLLVVVVGFQIIPSLIRSMIHSIGFLVWWKMLCSV